jgi:hypothetical protein
MAIVMPIYLAVVAALVGSVALPGDSPADLTGPPAVVATLQSSCTEEVPVPTITAEVVNHGNGPVAVGLFRNDVEIADVFVPGGESESMSSTSPHWEDVDNLFEIRDDGEVLASLEHHFDCLHPILDAEIGVECIGGAVDVEVVNSGHEGTHVSITRDGGVVAEPAVAPGHGVTVEVAVAGEQLIEVHHHGEVIAAALVDCDASNDEPVAGDGVLDEHDDTSGNSISEGDSGPTIDEVPEDVPGSVGSGDERDRHLGVPDSDPRTRDESPGARREVDSVSPNDADRHHGLTTGAMERG